MCTATQADGASLNIRTVDLCAGLGGFHRGLELAGLESPHFECVFASEIDPELRELYVRNFPSIRTNLSAAIPRSVLQATEHPATREAFDIYAEDGEVVRIPGDLAAFVDPDGEILTTAPETGEALFPDHDLLCAGFPCQPFSKSGSQAGFNDLRGTVFHLIAVILREKRPRYVFLENVGNFERHDGGRTWAVVRETLEKMGYIVSATLHRSSGGDLARGLLSPHHLGLPHHRERFFIVAHQGEGKPSYYPFPERPKGAEEQRVADRSAEAQLRRITSSGWTCSDRRAPPEAAQRAIVHWEALLKALSQSSYDFRSHMPSFPIWGYELDPWNWYPFHENPKELRARGELRHLRSKEIECFIRDGQDFSAPLDLSDFPPTGERAYLANLHLEPSEADRWVRSLPQYAISRHRWPRWKQRFINQNRSWALRLWTELDPAWLRAWLDQLFALVPAPSHQKLEWNCKGDPLTLADHVLQLRPSGIRVKRFAHVPALVAMTSTQVPLVSRAMQDRLDVRVLEPQEGLQLQGFPAEWKLPMSRDAAYKALGNAVHCQVVAEIAKHWLGQPGRDQRQLTLDVGADDKTLT